MKGSAGSKSLNIQILKMDRLSFTIINAYRMICCFVLNIKD
jgi:hypothetical protein